MRKLLTMMVATLLTSSAMAQNVPTSAAGFTGGWRLNSQGSHFIQPQNAPKDLIWAILFDSSHVQWNLVIVPQSGPPTFESFDSSLGAAPTPISGSPGVARATVTMGNGSFTVKSTHTIGDIKEISNTCALANSDKQLLCKGTATKSDGSTADFQLTFDRM